jgi:ABC-2 type transport system ATP-binding protein
LPFIDVVDLVREFRSHRRYPGAWGAVRSLVTREYDLRRAVDGISFTIERGEAVGYVGPNGAGKSTTIKVLTGILIPTSGIARVGGRDPYRHRTENARRMGVVFGQRSQLWWDLPLAQSFELHRHMYRIPSDRFRRTLAFCEDLLGVGEYRGVPVRQLSLGQRMRAELAQALLHEPDVLFLDEPTIGLDVLVKDRIRQFLRTANREFGMTIILTTHDLRDIEEICPRLLMIDRGRLVWDGAIADLKSQHQRTRTLVVEFARDPGRCDLPGAVLARDEGRRKTFRFDREATSVPALLADLMGRYAIEDAAVVEPDIEEVIRDLYESFGASRPAVAEEIDTWSRVRAVTQ